MEKSEIEKALAQFEAKLKQELKQPVPAKAKKPFPEGMGPPLKKVESAPFPSPPVAPPPAVPVGEPPCFNKPFKDMIKALSLEYVGNSLGKPFLVEFIDTQVNECS